MNIISKEELMEMTGSELIEYANSIGVKLGCNKDGTKLKESKLRAVDRIMKFNEDHDSSSDNSYEDFLKSKEEYFNPCGFECDPENENLFDFQRTIVNIALKRGKSALFLDTGLGKTICQLSWADEVYKHTKKNVLILAPLAVSVQTKREGEKFGIDVNICRTQKDVKEGINITNYEMLDHFNACEFAGIVLDESSILKSFSGKTTRALIDKFKSTYYKLACSATPAPNDYEELGNHSEFLGVMSRTEMLATYFVHDGGNTSKWRLKGHAEEQFWHWVSSWASVMKTPEDIGYNGDRYKLPDLNINVVKVSGNVKRGKLIPSAVTDLKDRREARKESLDKRVQKCAEIIEQSHMENCLVWCDFNDEGNALEKAIPDSVQVAGSDTSEHKEKTLLGFSTGDVKFLVSKPKIAGFGMNWQNCNNIIFCGISDSYEKYYQAIRRCYRFGQKKPVNVYIVISTREIPVYDNILEKGRLADKMNKKMVEIASRYLEDEIKNTHRIVDDYEADAKMKLPEWEEMV